MATKEHREHKRGRKLTANEREMREYGRKAEIEQKQTERPKSEKSGAMLRAPIRITAKYAGRDGGATRVNPRKLG